MTGHILPANHWLFQCANICLFISYGTTNLLVLRALLTLASLCFALWGGLILSISVDTVIWNSIFATVNFIHTIRIIYQMLPVKMDWHHTQVYKGLFGKDKPGGLSTHDFMDMTSSKLCFIRSMKAGTYFAQAGNVSGNLSLLISGKIQVTRPLHPKHDKTHENKSIDMQSTQTITLQSSPIIREMNPIPDTQNTNMNTASSGHHTINLAMSPIASASGSSSSSSSSPTVHVNPPSADSPEEEVQFPRIHTMATVPYELKKQKSMANMPVVTSEIVNYINALEFMDSPEFVSRKTARGSVYEVDMRVEEDVVYMMWPYEVLDDLFKEKPHLQHALNSNRK